jgi:hypothetical protein
VRGVVPDRSRRVARYAASRTTAIGASARLWRSPPRGQIERLTRQDRAKPSGLGPGTRETGDGMSSVDILLWSQPKGGISIIARNSSVEFVTGKGSEGTGNPSRSQIGSQPSRGCHSSSRPAGTVDRTASL